MSLLKKLAGETAIYGLSSIVGRLLNFLLQFVYTNMMLTAEFGVVSQFYAFTGFLAVIYSYRMETAFFRYGTPVVDRQQTYSTGVFSLLISTFLLTIAAFLLSQPIANLLLVPEHPEYVCYFALILAFDCLNELPYARLRLENKAKKFVSIRLFNIFATILLNLFWLMLCPWAAKNNQTWVHYFWSPNQPVKYIFLANVLASAGVLLLLFSELKDAFKAAFDKIVWKKMLRYAAPLIIVGFAGIINEMLDRAMMPYLLKGTVAENQAQLGIYGANYKLAMLISLFTQAYRYAAEPFFFKNANNEDALLTHAKATKWFTIVATSGMLAVLLYKDIIKYMLGANFREGLHIVPILLLANVLLGIYYNFSVWYRLKDKTDLGAWLSLGGAALTILLNIWWVPIYGYVGAAWATLVCYIFMTWVCWLVGKKYYPVDYPIARMCMYIGVALLLFGVSIFIEKILIGQPILFFMSNSLLMGIYIGLVYFLEKKTLKVA
jgi:O-antigen/teichoic acid export membrane protein